MSIKRNFAYTRTGRYFLSEPPASHHRHLCFVLHGHGQSPEYFLRKFTALSRKDILFVAPEGLHRYYLEGLSGRVGSTWMTREERLVDIADYCQMLNQIEVEVRGDADFEKTAILGFSQGVATACRWALERNRPLDRLIAWAGAFPPDLDFDAALGSLRDVDILLVAGDSDPFISPGDFEQQRASLHERGLLHESRLFAGRHEIPGPVLEEVIQETYGKQQASAEGA